MDARTRRGLVVVATVLLFLAVQLGALALAPTFQAGGGQAVENPDDPTNSVGYVGVVLVATAAMLLLIRLGAEQVIRGVVVLSSGFLSWYVLLAVLPKLLGGVVAPVTLSWAALAGGVGVLGGLVVHPEWYVIDAAGVLMGAGAAGLFGINFGLGPALLLLVVLAVYDAISVYRTGHMLTLAEGVVDLGVPVLLVVPARFSFSMADLGAAPNGADPPQEGIVEADDDTDGGSEPGTLTDAGPSGEVTDGNAGEADGAPGTSQADDDAVAPDPFARDALVVGLGDAVVPAVLVASSGFFLQRQAEPFVSGLVLNLPALGAMVGTVAGLLGLLYLVMQGRAHAGLPLLNGGAIAGYLAGALAAGVPLATALGL